jgi:quinol monooxygenase YgiN
MSDEQQGATRREFVAATAGAAVVAAIGFNRMSEAEDLLGPITQIVTLTLKAGAEEKAIATLQELTAAVKANEPGVLVYIAHRSQKDPTKIVFFEVYKDLAAAANHGKQPHMAKMFGMSKEIFDGPMDIQKMDRVSGYSRES